MRTFKLYLTETHQNLGANIELTGEVALNSMKTLAKYGYETLARTESKFAVEYLNLEEMSEIFA
jgi:hypothetical protein